MFKGFFNKRNVCVHFCVDFFCCTEKRKERVRFRFVTKQRKKSEEKTKVLIHAIPRDIFLSNEFWFSKVKPKNCANKIDSSTGLLPTVSK
jgi:hypothetical protein